MKKIVAILIFIGLTVGLQAQNIKKTFKLLEKKEFYKTALNEFNSSDYHNTSVGKYGTALIFNNPNYTFQVWAYNGLHPEQFYESNLYSYHPYYHQLTAYRAILESEVLFPKTNEADLKKLADYFSQAKISALKSELETFFLTTDEKNFVALHDSLSVLIEDSGFKKSVDNRFVGIKFAEIKALEKYRRELKVSRAEKLLAAFPECEQKTKIDFFKDSVEVSGLYNMYMCVNFLDENPNSVMRPELETRIKNYATKLQAAKKSNYEYIVFDSSYTEVEVLEKLQEYVLHNSSVSYYLQSDEDMTRSGISTPYLIFDDATTTIKKTRLQDLSSVRYQFPKAYIYVPSTGLKIYNTDEVYKGGELLTEYRAVAIVSYASYFEFEELCENLANKAREALSNADLGLQFVALPNSAGKYIATVNITDSPYPKEIDLTDDIPIDKYTDFSVYLVFLKTDGEIEVEIIQDDSQESISQLVDSAKRYFEK